MSRAEIEFAIPTGLSEKGRTAAEVIVAFLTDARLLDAGCGQHSVFHTPADWKARGEDYGLNSELIIMHDGGAHGAAFSYDRQCYATIEALDSRLAPHGLYVEQCTTWYSAVYVR